ncbi:MAG: hypothetical protein V1822_04245, partial [Candidatus Micrarchaeota archaeon]
MAAITYQDLFAIYRQEKGSNALCELPEGFDDGLQAMVEGLHEKSRTDAHALKELETAKKLAISIIQLRRQKIVLRAISAQDAKLMGANQREQDFYGHVQNVCQKQDLWLNKIIASRPQGPDAQNGGPKKSLKILQDVPQYSAADGKSYGPYKAGDIVELPKGEAKWMVEGKLAQEAGEKTNGANGNGEEKEGQKIVKIKVIT